MPAVNAKPPAVAFDQGRNSRAKLGFVVLAMEQTVEADVFRLAPEGVGIHFSRMPMSNSVSFEALAGMAPQIADSAALLLPEDRLDVACYTCNSGTMVIGESEVVDTLAASGCRPRASTTVMTGVVRALDAVGARTISVAAPYHDEVNSVVRRFLAGHGFAIADYRSMDLTRNSDIDRVTPASIAEFARAADKPDSDAVFICCGALRALDVVQEIEDELGKPVIVSNQAMMWDCLRLAGIDDPMPGHGRLFELGVARHAQAACKPLLHRLSPGG